MPGLVWFGLFWFCSGLVWQPGGASRSQKEPGGARRSQEDPRGPRKTQEGPGASRPASSFVQNLLRFSFRLFIDWAALGAEKRGGPGTTIDFD